MRIPTFLKNKYIQAVLIFVIGAGGYLVGEYLYYVYFSAENNVEERIVETMKDAETAPKISEDDTPPNDGEERDLSGIHIMPNGTVMLGSGEVLESATVTDDGMIELEDGTIVLPRFDLR